MQGNVIFDWHVTLRRVDLNQLYEPTSEAYDIPAINDALESDRYSISIIPYLTMRFSVTPELTKFLTGLKDPKKLEIGIKCYPRFWPKEKYLVWSGLLQNLPEGDTVYPVTDLTLTFVGNPGWWGDADSVKDPDTNTWYSHKHMTDTVLPALFKTAAGVTGGDFTVEPPTLRGAVPFWSALERPIKALCTNGEAPYDGTCEVSGLCWDSTRSLLYAGVHDAVGSGTLPWLVSFNPATREWLKVTQFRYAGVKSILRPPTEWEVQHLEYDATLDRVWYVCRTNHQNLADAKAHFKCWGYVSAASPPAEEPLADANLFTLHDKGIVINSRVIEYNNTDATGHPPNVDGVEYWADMFAQVIGWGTPRHSVKECGPLTPTPKRLGELLANTVLPYGECAFAMKIAYDKNQHPRVGYFLDVIDNTNENRQGMGRIIRITDKVGYFWVECQYPARADYLAADTEIYMYAPDDTPEDNIFIAEPQEISLRFLQSSLADYDSTDVYIERRRQREGLTQFYWPEDIATVSSDGPCYIDEVGYISFFSARPLGVIDQDDPLTFVQYKAGETSDYEIKIKPYNATFLIADGLKVESELQDALCHRQPGRCRLTYNGATVKVSDGSLLETYGDIFLYKDNGTVYVAWNDHGRDNNLNWFSKCKLGRWTGTQVVKLWVDRFGESWRTEPENYIKSFIRHNGNSYFGRRYCERHWLHTDLMIFWAAPPQTEIRPVLYQGDLVAIAAVKGDKSEVLKNGDLIRLGGFGTPDSKEYRISDVTVLERSIGTSSWGTGYAVPSQVPYSGIITFFAVLSLDSFNIKVPGAYNAQVGREIRGKYISVAKGRDERAQVAKL